jgi:hypothetical protein
MSKPAPVRYEMHEHKYIAGPNSRRTDLWTLVHAHPDGSRPHRHPDTGPARYTIDRDEWAAVATGVGGGRRLFRAKPTGPQLEYVEPEPADQTFEVIYVDRGHTAAHAAAGIDRERYERERAAFLADAAAGEGGLVPARLQLAFRMRPVYRYEDVRGGEGR